MAEHMLEDKQAAEFAVDREHGALRFTVVIIFVVGWILAFVVLNALIANEGLNIIAIVASFGVTALLTQQLEKALKDRWPSGRALKVENNRIRLVQNDTLNEEIDAGQQVNVLLWRFQISRRSRVPKGWLMVACALEQDETYIPIYTFMSPDQFDSIAARGQFVMLQSKKERQKQGSDMRLAGEQRRLHTAESARWMSGAEMTADDFLRFVGYLQEQFPQWMPSVV